MSRAIPCAGYPSRGKAVAALDREGKTIDEIERETGLERGQIIRLRHNARRQRRDKAAFLPVTAQLPQAVFRAFKQEAERRKTTPDALATQILRVCAQDGLVNAVLDE